jgi:hypothetical protein
MKREKKDLDVDYIGGQGSLTVEEEKAISHYLLQHKLLRSSSTKTNSRNTKRTKTTA